MKLWGGRFESGTDAAAHGFNASLPFDRRMADEDVTGSIAWARGLGRIGVLEAEEVAALVAGLEQVRAELAAGDFSFHEADEDIHTAVERRLGEVAGEVAGKLHTGRSRNDQVATDFRLWVMRACTRLDGAVAELQAALADSAEGHLDAPMAGYTHWQPAQAITWGHWALSHVWALARDRRRLAQARTAAAALPLGSAALAGSGFPVDRAWLARELAFDTVLPNSLDAVSDRDFAAELLFAAAMTGLHLSRLGEQLILYANPALGFVELDDAYATGSSLMPQKKNPDMLELARGKAGRLIGNLLTLMTVLKGLPSAYDKDLQEDKEPVFDAVDTLEVALPVVAGLVRTLRVREDRLLAALDPAMWATDLADRLVRAGIPFREAHHVVGRVVRAAEERGIGIDALGEPELAAIDPRLPKACAGAFDWPVSLASRAAEGGTAPEALRAQLAAARAAIEGGGG